MGRHLSAVPDPAPPAPARRWLLASALLGKPVPVDEPYPHICGVELASIRYRFTRRDCGACADHAAQRAAARGAA